MRMNKGTGIIPLGGAEPGQEQSESAGASDNDFISRLNSAITNFKDLLVVAKQLKGGQPGNKEADNLPAKTPGLFDYVQLISKAGYGNTPIGKLIEQLSPHTLNQIMEVIKNARPRE